MRIFLLLFIIAPLAVRSQSSIEEKQENLQKYWRVFTQGEFVPYHGQSAHTIHLLLDNNLQRGHILIEAPGEFAVFLNGKLSGRMNEKVILDVDSIISKDPSVSLLSIFQKANVNSLKTHLLVNKDVNNERYAREDAFFSNFVIISSLILFGFFVFLYRSNTRLTIDYLNIFKVFALQEREEAIITGRIGSSVNILFFVFISLLWGLLLIILFHSENTWISNLNAIDTTPKIFLLWLIISLLFFCFLIVKLLLSWIFSRLFSFKDVVRFQFFNFIRSLYATSAALSVALVIYFMIDGVSLGFYQSLLISASIFMVLSGLLFYFKLMSRISVSIFHLFSYLCGSEIIPLMILIKVLLN